jgi:hypothetical protein
MGIRLWLLARFTVIIRRKAEQKDIKKPQLIRKSLVSRGQGNCGSQRDEGHGKELITSHPDNRKDALEGILGTGQIPPIAGSRM